jgi:maltooligosyltrehalose trehalohydrolase
VDAARFVTYLENHDQVANSARGLRLKDLSSPGCYRALSALWLLAPQTPMFFHGQELGTSRPFVYFFDHVEPLADLVRKGRAQELSGFRSTTHPAVIAATGEAGSRASFQEARLESPEGYRDNPLFRLFQDLLRLRRDDSIFRAQRADRLFGAVLGPQALAIRFFGEDEDCRLLLVNLGRDLYPVPSAEPLLAPPPDRGWSQLWFSEHPRYNGSGIPPLKPGPLVEMAGHCAVVLSPSPVSPRPDEPAMGSTIVENFNIHPAIRPTQKGHPER